MPIGNQAKPREAGDSGTVILDFALCFPLLLLLFVFALNLLQVYTWDIVGSYAAFAAARSYSVFRNHEGSDAEQTAEQTAEKAAKLARDVAATIMAVYSAKIPGFDDHFQVDEVDGEKAEGVAQFWETAEKIGLFAGKSVSAEQAFKVAVARMNAVPGQAFKIVEYGGHGSNTLTVGLDGTVASPGHSSDQPFDLRFRSGYGYIDDLPKEQQENARDGFWEKLWEGWTSIWKSLFGGGAEDGLASMRVARVSFSYAAPFAMGFWAKGYLQPDPDADRTPWALPIYQACAAPVEPHILLPPETPPETYQPPKLDDAKLQQELRKLNYAVRQKLQAFHDFVYRDARLHTAPEKSKSLVKIMAERPSRKAAGGSNIWGDGKQPPDWEFARDALSAYKHVFPDLTAYKLISGKDSEDVGTVTLPDGKLTSAPHIHDVRQLLRDEIAYRSKVIGWIDVELAGVAEELKILSADKANLNKIDNEYNNPSKVLKKRVQTGTSLTGRPIYRTYTRKVVDTSKLKTWRNQLSSQYCQDFKTIFNPTADTQYDVRLQHNTFSAERSQLHTKLDAKIKEYTDKQTAWGLRREREDDIKTADMKLQDDAHTDLKAIATTLEKYYEHQQKIRSAKTAVIDASAKELGDRLNL